MSLPFTEKYQAGETYADEPKQTKTKFLDDPVKLATEIFSDLAAVRSEITLPELIGIIKGTINKGEPVDDRKG